jgi:hypothetical protein
MRHSPFLLFALICIMCDFVYGQEKNNSNSWHLRVIDSASGNGIDKANVSINRRSYYQTNFKGFVNIDRSLINNNDTIRITCIGYRPIEIPVSLNHAFPDFIRLSFLVKALSEVKIGYRKSADIIVGTELKSHLTLGTARENSLYVKYIPNDTKINGVITSINYQINDNIHGIELPFKVRLFRKSKDNPFPAEELIKDTIIVYNPQRKTTLSVDITKYNISMPDDGVMVGFETLSPEYYSGKDSVWYKGYEFLPMPGLDMYLKKKTISAHIRETIQIRKHNIVL